MQGVQGIGLCEHQRIRREYKECKGSGICEHQRQRSRCKQCKGSGICEHRRRRRECKECKGSSICEHQRQRSLCKECRDAASVRNSRFECPRDPRAHAMQIKCPPVLLTLDLFFIILLSWSMFQQQQPQQQQQLLPQHCAAASPLLVPCANPYQHTCLHLHLDFLHIYLLLLCHASLLVPLGVLLGGRTLYRLVR